MTSPGPPLPLPRPTAADPAGLPVGPPPRPVPSGRIRSAVWPFLVAAYWAFLFSIPFETLELGIGTGIFSISKLVGYGFFLISLLVPADCYARVPRALACFAVPILISFFYLPLLDPVRTVPVIVGMITGVQMLVLFWVTYNLALEEDFASAALKVIVLSCAFLTLFQITGLTTTLFQPNEDEIYDRITALSENPNTTGGVLAIGLLALIGEVFLQTGIHRLVTVAALPVALLMGLQLVWTGSRGALVAFVAGAGVLLLQGRNVLSKVQNLAVLAAIGVGLVAFVFNSEPVMNRWMNSFHDGDLATRDEIFAEAWDMVLERPFLGWGPVEHYYELGARLGAQTKDMHNLYLWVLTETGLVGSIPVGLGLWYCGAGAWRGRHGPQGVVPFALLVVLLCLNMSGTWHIRKLHWVILALAAAAGDRAAAGPAAPPGPR